MNFGVSLFLVRSGKFPAARITRKWFLSCKIMNQIEEKGRSSSLTCVSPDVSGEVVRPTEGSHTYSALERFLAWNTTDVIKTVIFCLKVPVVTCVYSDVSRQFVTPRKSPVALVDRTSVGSLMDWSLAGSVWILPRPHRHQVDGDVG